MTRFYPKERQRMSRFNWDRAKKPTGTRALADEKEWAGKDAAARWLAANDGKAGRGKKKKPKPQRRVDRLPAPSADRPDIIIYTDGACHPNPGKGGWGFAVYDKGVEIHSQSGGSPASTNNIMEMTGLKMALLWAIEHDVRAVFVSDSQYVVTGCNEWRFGWKAKGWRRITGRKSGKMEPVKNADLWREIDELLRQAPATIEWCKGHAGILGNERADELSNMGRGEAA